MKLPEGKKEAEKVFEKKVAKNSLNLVKNINLKIQQAQQTQVRVNTKRSTCRYIIDRLVKSKMKKKS